MIYRKMMTSSMLALSAQAMMPRFYPDWSRVVRRGRRRLGAALTRRRLPVNTTCSIANGAQQPEACTSCHIKPKMCHINTKHTLEHLHGKVPKSCAIVITFKKKEYFGKIILPMKNHPCVWKENHVVTFFQDHNNNSWIVDHATLLRRSVTAAEAHTRERYNIPVGWPIISLREYEEQTFYNPLSTIKIEASGCFGGKERTEEVVVRQYVIDGGPYNSYYFKHVRHLAKKELGYCPFFKTKNLPESITVYDDPGELVRALSPRIEKGQQVSGRRRLARSRWREIAHRLQNPTTLCS